MRIACASIAILAVASCGKPDDGKPAVSGVPASPAQEVAAADGYGEQSDRVNAVAFWSHPSVNFESLIIAATDSGTRAYQIESGDLVAETDAPAAAISVFYFGSGPSARGFALTKENDAYRLYEIGNGSPGLTPVALQGGAAAGDGFCAGAGALYEISANALSVREIALTAGGASIAQPRAVADVAGSACHVDVRTGDVIVIGLDGAIRRVNPSTGESSGIAFASGEPDASALFLMTGPEPERAPGGVVLTLDAASGVVSLYDLLDGRALGAVRIKATFDLDAVATATTVAAGFGNYGGVYRDGALAIVTAGDGAPVRLAPWNGVADALKLPLGENVDPRAPQAAREEESLISIDLEHP